MDAEDQHLYISWQKSHRRGKIAAGIIIILYGILFLLRELNALGNEENWKWAFTAGPIIISVGLIVLIKHKFKSLFGYFLILLGKILLLYHFYPHAINIKKMWPLLVIFVGLMILFRPKRSKNWKRHRHYHHRYHRHDHPFWKHDKDFFEQAEALDNISADDFIDAVSIFGGVQRNVVSKSFRGADIVTIFGGNDINLSQADFNEQIVMDVTNIFGGTTLTIPNNWEIQSEIVTILGSLEDKRPLMPKDEDRPKKIVILRGTCLFGGIEINSFNS